MKTVFDKPTRDELIHRVHTLQQHQQAQWGKMNVYQMLKHCTLWEDMIMGHITTKRVFIGRIFGKMALKSILKDDSPIGKNSPTIPALRINETNGDILLQKKEWIHRLEQYAHFTTPYFVHPFFGKMSKEQVGRMAYKHADHHLRQFGA